MPDWIITAPKGGRRRAGRRWEEGETRLPEAEQSKALWAAISRDDRMNIRSADPADPMAEAIRSLGPDGFTSGDDPMPKVDALGDALGRRITAAERDAAWATIREGFTMPAEGSAP